MTATLPYPPSANRFWRHFRGRVVLSAEGRAYKQAVALLLRKAKPAGHEVSVHLHFYRPRKSGDLDNRIKLLLDSLNGLAWEDDDQVVELHAWRHDDKKKPRVEVTILPMGAPFVLP